MKNEYLDMVIISLLIFETGISTKYSKLSNAKFYLKGSIGVHQLNIYHATDS